MTDNRKTLPQLKTEVDSLRRMQSKTYVHKKSGDEYQMLFVAFEEASNQAVIVYTMCAMPWLKFTRPVSEFLEKFEERGLLK